MLKEIGYSDRRLALLAVLLVIAAGSVSAAYWTNNPVNCPQTYAAQSCIPIKVCGVTSGDVAQCYNTALINAPLADAESETLYSGAFGGGYLIDCYSYDGVSPHCDNGGAEYCNANATCAATHNNTNCYAGAWESSNCTDNCNSGWIQCFTADECDIQVGSACSSGGLPGTWSASCVCVTTPQHHLTGTQANGSSANPNLWTNQSGTGSIFRGDQSAFGYWFEVNASGCLLLNSIEGSSWTCNLTGTGGGGGTSDYSPFTNDSVGEVSLKETYFWVNVSTNFSTPLIFGSSNSTINLYGASEPTGYGINVQGGNHDTGEGQAIVLHGGNAAGGSNNNGGSVALVVGSGDGTGSAGYVNINARSTAMRLIGNFTPLEAPPFNLITPWNVGSNDTLWDSIYFHGNLSNGTFGCSLQDACGSGGTGGGDYSPWANDSAGNVSLKENEFFVDIQSNLTTPLIYGGSGTSSKLNIYSNVPNGNESSLGLYGDLHLTGANLQAGIAVTGAGQSISVTGGNAYGGSGELGGAVTITAGTGDGAGADGAINLVATETGVSCNADLLPVYPFGEPNFDVGSDTLQWNTTYTQCLSLNGSLICNWSAVNDSNSPWASDGSNVFLVDNSQALNATAMKSILVYGTEHSNTPSNVNVTSEGYLSINSNNWMSGAGFTYSEDIMISTEGAGMGQDKTGSINLTTGSGGVSDQGDINLNSEEGNVTFTTPSGESIFNQNATFKQCFRLGNIQYCTWNNTGNHSLLTNLNADDHAQYLNVNGRGSGQTAYGAASTGFNNYLRFSAANNSNKAANITLYDGNAALGGPVEITTANATSTTAGFILIVAGNGTTTGGQTSIGSGSGGTNGGNLAFSVGVGGTTNGSEDHYVDNQRTLTINSGGIVGFQRQSRARRVLDNSITIVGWTPIIFGTLYFDQQNEFTNPQTFFANCPVTQPRCYYQANCHLQFADIQPMETLGIAITVNGMFYSTSLESIYNPDPTQYHEEMLSDVLELSNGDRVECWGYSNGHVTVQGDGGEPFGWSYFSLHKLS